MDFIKAIESNLHQFYEFIAIKGGLELSREDHYSVVRNNQYSWPNWVFRPDRELLPEEDFIQPLTDKIKTGEIPSFLVTLEPDNPAKFYLLMEQYGMRQIYTWKGMAIEKDNYHDFDHHGHDFIIVEVSTDELLAEWINVVNTALFNSKSLDFGLMKCLYQQEQINLYLGIVSGSPVATSLSFQNDDIAGLYMIATMPEYRGKGYGTIITCHTIEHCFRQDARYIILHSSPLAENIYRKIGFREYCKFGILWMVGKEYR